MSSVKRDKSHANVWVSKEAVAKLRKVCATMEEEFHKSNGMRVNITQGAAIEALCNEYLKTMESSHDMLANRHNVTVSRK